MIREKKGDRDMAFTNTHMRSASFGIVTSLPDDIIDSFWYIIDHFLKNVFELEEELEFQLLNNQGKITFHFSSQHLLQPLILTLTILSTLVIPQEYWF